MLNLAINKRKTLVQQQTYTIHIQQFKKITSKTGEPKSKLKMLLQENIQLFRVCKKL